MCAIFLSLLMKKVKSARNPVHRQMLLKIETRESVQDSRGLVWISRLVTDTDQISQLDGPNFQVLFQLKNGARDSFVSRNTRAAVGTRDLARQPSPERISILFLKITGSDHFREQVLRL